MDSDGYPDDEELAQIKAWSYADMRGLFDFIRDLWSYPNYWDEVRYTDGLFGSGTRISMSTGGWSGNESLIDALGENLMAWSMTWESAKRGGHYTFTLRDETKAEAAK